MSLQYIHTSARRGLEPGKSGFCCVARDRDLPADLEKELEKLSRYEHIPGKSSPVILRHLTLPSRTGNFHILTRLSDSGTDYSKRNNHIAHHLAFSEDEISVLPDPATILLFWKGWKNSWIEPPRILQERDQFKIGDLDISTEVTSIDFDSPIETGSPRDSAFIVEAGKEPDLAHHFRNELVTLPASQRWDVPFTNFILTSDQPTQFLWRGNWKDRPLPFEFERLSDKVGPIVSPRITEEQPPNEPEDDSHRITKSAPKVEIPTELTRADRKRPKLKWTRRRLSNTLNLTLACLAILCCGTIAYLLLDFSSPPEPAEPQIPQEAASSDTGDPNSGADGSLDPHEAWMSLIDSGRLYEDIELGLNVAEALSSLGQPKPLQIAKALSAVRDSIENRPPEPITIVPVPSSLVHSDTSQWFLEPEFASALESLGALLIPESLIPFFQEPLASNPIFGPLREHGPFDRFIPEDTILSIKAVRRAARDRLIQNGIDAITAAEEYRKQWQSLSGDDVHHSIQKLETAFELNPSERYLAQDSNGLLISPTQIEISEYLRTLYEGFMLRRVSSFISSPEFRDALNTANQERRTAIELARSIHPVFVTARALSEPMATKLENIREQWRETFIRDDLMEETMINFNLERLANRKRHLSTLQSQFSQSTLADLDSTNRILDSVDKAEQSIQAINSNSEWALLLGTP